MRAIVRILVVLTFAAAAHSAHAQDGPPTGPGPQGPLPALAEPGVQPPPGSVPAQPPPAKAPRAQTPTPMPIPPGAIAPAPMPTPPAPGVQLVKRAINIQVEVTITDQVGTAAPEKKTVSMIAADGTWSRIRAGGEARPTERPNIVISRINVDARPYVMPNSTDTIQLELTIEYQPLRAMSSGTSPQSAGQQHTPTNLDQSMSVILISGKPLQISQAADPITDRKILCEVKATILK